MGAGQVLAKVDDTQQKLALAVRAGRAGVGPGELRRRCYAARPRSSGRPTRSRWSPPQQGITQAQQGLTNAQQNAASEPREVPAGDHPGAAGRSRPRSRACPPRRPRCTQAERRAARAPAVARPAPRRRGESIDAVLTRYSARPGRVRPTPAGATVGQRRDLLAGRQPHVVREERAGRAVGRNPGPVGAHAGAGGSDERAAGADER